MGRKGLDRCTLQLPFAFRICRLRGFPLSARKATLWRLRLSAPLRRGPVLMSAWSGNRVTANAARLRLKGIRRMTSQIVSLAPKTVTRDAAAAFLASCTDDQLVSLAHGEHAPTPLLADVPSWLAEGAYDEIDRRMFS